MVKRFTVAALLALAFLPASAGTAAAREAFAADVPIFESNRATVAAIYGGNAADFVLVDAGYDRDFCTGARCAVERAGVPVAEIVIAESSRERAVALIIHFENNQKIQTGDTVKLKTI